MKSTNIYLVNNDSILITFLYGLCHMCRLTNRRDVSASCRARIILDEIAVKYLYGDTPTLYEHVGVLTDLWVSLLDPLIEPNLDSVPVIVLKHADYLVKDCELVPRIRYSVHNGSTIKRLVLRSVNYRGFGGRIQGMFRDTGVAFVWMDVKNRVASCGVTHG
jgi:hypothetical protein